MVHRIGIFKAMRVFEQRRVSGPDAAAKMLVEELAPKNFGINSTKSFNASRDVFREAVWQTRKVEMDGRDPLDSEQPVAESIYSYSEAVADDPSELIERLGSFLVRRKFKAHPSGFVSSAHLSVSKGLRFMIGAAQFGSTGGSCRLFV